MAYSKYGNNKIEVNGIQFHSVLESRFYNHLLGLVESGEVTHFEMQVPFELLPGYTNVVGKKIKPITYLMDFIVYYKDKSIDYIDIKSEGTMTDVFLLKKKLFEYKFQHELKCIGHSTLDGGWIPIEHIKKGRKARKKARESK